MACTVRCGLLAALVLSLSIRVCEAACPSVAITPNVWVDGYHSENVLFADASDNCAVKCSAGWLWLGQDWPNFQQENSVTYDGSVYSAGDISSKNITCTCPPPTCGNTCPQSIVVKCDPTLMICSQAVPNVKQTSDGCSQITCPSGASLLSPAFESWRVGSFAQCGADNIWYAMTGFILNDTSYVLTCAVEKGGNSCPKITPTNSCPNGFTCDGSAVSSTDNQGTTSVSCKSGVLAVVNDPKWGQINPDGSAISLTCGESNRWYKSGGVTTAGTPQVTCITGTAPTTQATPATLPPTKPPTKSCPGVSAVKCNPTYEICGVNSAPGGSDNTFTCPPGNKLGGSPGLSNLNTNAIQCSPDGQWTTSSGSNVPSFQQLTCIVTDTGNQCQGTVAGSGCPIGYKCEGSVVHIQSVTTPTGESVRTVRCIAGVPMITNDPASSQNIDLSKNVQYVCGKDNRFYTSPGGVPTNVANPQFTCVLSDCTDCCPTLSAATCDPNTQICGPAPSAPTLSTGVPQSYTCPSPTKLTGSPTLNQAKVNSITCGMDTTWTTGAQPVNDVRQITCSILDGGTNCQGSVAGTGCPPGYSCQGAYGVIGTVTSPFGQQVKTATCSQGVLMVTNDPTLSKFDLNAPSPRLICGSDGMWYASGGANSGQKAVRNPTFTCVLGEQAKPACQTCVHPSQNYPGLPGSYAQNTHTYPISPIQIKNGCSYISNFCGPNTKVMAAYLPDGTPTLLPVWQVDLPYYFTCNPANGNWIMGFTATTWTIEFRTAVCADIVPTICTTPIPLISTPYVQTYNDLAQPVVPINLPIQVRSSVNSSAICPPGFNLAMDLEYPVRGVLVTRPEFLGPVEFYCMYNKYIYDYAKRCNPVRSAGCIRCKGLCFSSP